VGRVLQDATLFQDLTIREAVSLAAPHRPADVDGALEAVGLAAWSGARCQDVPTGTRRLVELACAIAGRPRLLLLDEPAAGLSSGEVAALGPLIAALRGVTGATVVLVEHDVGLVAGVADRLLCLEAGRVLAVGPPGDVLADPAVRASFLGGRPLG
jgi:branched-chain amino acid transport system ATP-binding protein